MTRSAYLCWGFLLGFLTVSTAWGNALDQKPASSGDDVRFAELCKTAEGQFSPIQSSQVQTVLCRVRQKTDALECRLVDWGSKPEKIWRDYLDWDQWAGEVKKTSPDLTKLDAIYSRLGRDDGALGLVWFVELRQALGDYLNVARGVDNPEIQKAYKKLLVFCPVWSRITKKRRRPTKRPRKSVRRSLGSNGFIRPTRWSPTCVAGLVDRISMARCPVISRRWAWKNRWKKKSPFATASCGRRSPEAVS